MLGVALAISGLAVRLREQVLRSRAREHRTAALYEMSRELIETADLDEVLVAGTRQLRTVFGLRPVILLPGEEKRLVPWPGTAEEPAPVVGPQELGVAQWVYDHGERAGAGTDTLPSANGLYLPLSAPAGTVGVFGALDIDAARFRDPEQLHLLETFLHRVAAGVERSRLADETRRVRELQELDRLKSEFVATASHELKAPLASLALTVGRLRSASPGVGSEWMAQLDAAEEQVVRLRRLADDLLDLARLEAGRVELHILAVDAGALVREQVDLLQQVAAERGVRLGLDVPDGLPAVAADRNRLGRVIDNLVLNALRQVGVGGRVLVSVDAFGRFVQVSVADDGPGISIEDQARIFDRFVRLGQAGPDGSGLGLPIAREIVRAHGGAIWVDSGLGPGSVFSFTVPVAAGDGKDAAE